MAKPIGYMHYFLQSGERELFAQPYEHVRLSVSKEEDDAYRLSFSFADKQDFSDGVLTEQPFYSFKAKPTVIEDQGINKSRPFDSTIDQLKRLEGVNVDATFRAVSTPQKPIAPEQAQMILRDEKSVLWFWGSTATSGTMELAFKADKHNEALGKPDRFKLIVTINIPEKDRLRY